ncbi:MAG TPA: DIP1984 family protein [Thermomicrobiales bacterium]|nr:DIP1984 family protein [Thermomicrobiales bacterium]
MKLAEALILRADAQKRIEQLKQRLLRNAKVQEGDTPAENPRDLIAELDRVAADLTRLIRQINRTNAATVLADGSVVSDALARRDVLAKQHAVYRDLAATATVDQTRYSRSEVKFVSTVDVAATQRRADDLARQHRELDAAIQAANWSIDLLES